LTFRWRTPRLNWTLPPGSPCGFRKGTSMQDMTLARTCQGNSPRLRKGGPGTFPVPG